MNRAGNRFQTALQHVRNGSDEAVWQLIEEYGPHIHRVVRRSIDRRIRSKFDSIDFVQMVWASFFRHPSQIADFEQPNELVGFLAVVARNKVVEENRRRLGTQKHNVKCERSLDQGSRVSSDHLPGRQASPSQIAIARERWRGMMNRKPERFREVVRLRLRGATYVEISQALGIHERTARRLIEQLEEFPRSEAAIAEDREQAAQSMATGG